MGGKTVPSDANGVYESKYMRVPISKTRWQIFKDQLYNSQDGTIMTRTKKQWGITGLFYLVFFSSLGFMFAVCMAGMLATLDDKQPRYILDESLIGINPGLAFRPNISDGNLISYKSSNESDVKYWIKQLDAFLDEYKNTSKLSDGRQNRQECNYGQSVRDGMVCDFDVSQFDNCTSKKGYGFSDSSPCIFLKLNRIIGWVPQVYNDTDNLPSEMPDSLVAKIISLKGKPEINSIWLSCAGRKPKDDEAIGKIEYYPSTQGFPSYYYPYNYIKGYLSPLVAVHFQRPKRNEIISVVCRAWAKNIQQHLHDQIGVITFQLSINA